MDVSKFQHGVGQNSFHLVWKPKYVGIYKPRWNIETMFRVHDEARIKSKSTRAITRLFYFTISMLLLLIWNLHHKTKTTFKLFTTILYEQIFFQILKIPYTSPL